MLFASPYKSAISLFCLLLICVFTSPNVTKADDSTLWEALKSGQDCIAEIPAARWSLEGFFEADMQQAGPQGKSYSKWGGFIEGFAEFDPLFFGVSPLEAKNMDPHERLFITCCWQVS